MLWDATKLLPRGTGFHLLFLARNGFSKRSLLHKEVHHKNPELPLQPRRKKPFKINSSDLFQTPTWSGTGTGHLGTLYVLYFRGCRAGVFISPFQFSLFLCNTRDSLRNNSLSTSCFMWAKQMAKNKVMAKHWEEENGIPAGSPTSSFIDQGLVPLGCSPELGTSEELGPSICHIYPLSVRENPICSDGMTAGFFECQQIASSPEETSTIPKVAYPFPYFYRH